MLEWRATCPQLNPIINRADTQSSAKIVDIEKSPCTLECAPPPTTRIHQPQTFSPPDYAESQKYGLARSTRIGEHSQRSMNTRHGCRRESGAVSPEFGLPHAAITRGTASQPTPPSVSRSSHTSLDDMAVVRGVP